MKVLKHNALEDNKREQVATYILDYLKGCELQDMVLSEEKTLKTEVTADGSVDLVLYGKFIPQDSIKNQLALGDVSQTTLMEYTKDKSALTIGTHERVDGVFNDLKEVMSKEISWMDIKHFTELNVTEHDFFGRGFIVASLNYPANKLNRVALHK